MGRGCDPFTLVCMDSRHVKDDDNALVWRNNSICCSQPGTRFQLVRVRATRPSFLDLLGVTPENRHFCISRVVPVIGIGFLRVVQ